MTEDEMRPRMRTYTACSLGVAIVWAILLVLAPLLAPAGRRHNIFLVFRFAIGGLSPTIARYVYPPSKRYRQDAGKRTLTPESSDREARAPAVGGAVGAVQRVPALNVG